MLLCHVPQGCGHIGVVNNTFISNIIIVEKVLAQLDLDSGLFLVFAIKSAIWMNVGFSHSRGDAVSQNIGVIVGRKGSDSEPKEEGYSSGA